MGRFEEVVDSSREALRIDPDSNAAKYALAVSYSKLGKEEEAIAFYRSLLRDDPERAPDIYNELGQLYVRKARHAEAIEAFKAGISFGKDDMVIPLYFCLGSVLHNKWLRGKIT